MIARELAEKLPQHPEAQVMVRAGSLASEQLDVHMCRPLFGDGGSLLIVGGPVRRMVGAEGPSNDAGGAR